MMRHLDSIFVSLPLGATLKILRELSQSEAITLGTLSRHGTPSCR